MNCYITKTGETAKVIFFQLLYMCWKIKLKLSQIVFIDN